MSQRSSGLNYRADSGRMMPTEAPRAAPQAASKPAAKAVPPGGGTRRTDYTIAHAGHQFRLGPITFWIAVGSLVIMAGWSLATGTYFAFHDDVLSRLIARQKEQQFAYEDRIAELRAQVDRITSRQLLNQEQFDQKLEQIMRRQAALESRAGALGAIPDNSVTGSIRPQARGAAGAEASPSWRAVLSSGASIGGRLLAFDGREASFAAVVSAVLGFVACFGAAELCAVPVRAECGDASWPA